MGWLERLNRIKKETGKTTDEISELSGIPKGTLNKLFAGQTKDPQLSTIRAVVHCMGYTLDDLDDGEIEKAPTKTASESGAFSEREILMIKKYRLLDQRGQQTVNDTLERELKYILRDNNMVEMSEIASDAIDTIDKIAEAIHKNQHNTVLKK